MVAALSREGLLGATLATSRRPWMQFAAAVLLFTAGALAGAVWNDGPATVARGQPRFLLLLEGGESVSREETFTVEAYRAWAGELRNAGRFITGECPAGDAAVVPGVGIDDENRVQAIRRAPAARC